MWRRWVRGGRRRVAGPRSAHGRRPPILRHGAAHSTGPGSRTAGGPGDPAPRGRRHGSGWRDSNSRPSAPKADALPPAPHPVTPRSLVALAAVARRRTPGSVRTSPSPARSPGTSAARCGRPPGAHDTVGVHRSGDESVPWSPSRAPGHAGVAQWQSPSLPSWSCGFDSRRPLPIPGRGGPWPDPTPGPTVADITVHGLASASSSAEGGTMRVHQPAVRLLPCPHRSCLRCTCPRCTCL